MRQLLQHFRLARPEISIPYSILLHMKIVDHQAFLCFGNVRTELRRYSTVRAFVL
jgi:hypothetical protein